MMKNILLVSCASLLLLACDRHELREAPPTDTAPATASAPAAPNRAPAEPAITPTTGAGSSGSFVIRFSDPDGLADLQWGQVLFNKQLGGPDACYLHWENAANGLYLMNDKADALLGPQTPGRPAVLENKQCRIDVAQATVTRTADSVELTVPIQFKPSFRRAQKIYLRAADRGNHTLEWKVAGSWEVR